MTHYYCFNCNLIMPYDYSTYLDDNKKRRCNYCKRLVIHEKLYLTLQKGEKDK